MVSFQVIMLFPKGGLKKKIVSTLRSANLGWAAWSEGLRRPQIGSQCSLRTLAEWLEPRAVCVLKLRGASGASGASEKSRKPALVNLKFNAKSALLGALCL